MPWMVPRRAGGAEPCGSGRVSCPDAARVRPALARLRLRARASPHATPVRTPASRLVPDWAKPHISFPTTSCAGKHLSRSVMAAGWPMRCLWSSEETDFDVIARQTKGAIHVPRMLGASPAGSHGNELPYYPSFAGIAVNTAVYAMGWRWLLLVPTALCRGMSKRRGRCVRCNYSLAGLPSASRCPECGHTEGD